MKYIVMSVLLVGGVLFAAPQVFAATYEYVNTAGTIQAINADNATQALATAPNIHPRSGVMLVSGAVVVTGGNLFAYVDSLGSLRNIVALDANQALAIAPNRAPTSGVMRLN